MKRRGFFRAVCAIALFALISAVGFEALHAEHDCTGEDSCAVCLIIQMVRTSLRAADVGSALLFVHTGIVALAVLLGAFGAFFVRATPVSAKIRLND